MSLNAMNISNFVIFIIEIFFFFSFLMKLVCFRYFRVNKSGYENEHRARVKKKNG